MAYDSIPLVDLRAQFQSLSAGIIDAVLDGLGSCDFILGEAVTRFEREFAEFCEIPHAVGCGSGTDALQLALRAIPLAPGSEVIVPAYGDFGTALAVELAGGVPKLADVDPETALIDPSQLEDSITSNTRAIIAAHLFGQCAPMEEIREIAEQYGLIVIEDATQAPGALFEGQRAGSLADIGCFSFHPGRNLGAFGDAGCIVTRDAELAERLRALRDLGRISDGSHEFIGLNSRLDTLQARILRAKLPLLDSWNERRRALASRYDEAFSRVADVSPCKIAASNQPVYFRYVVRSPRRAEILAELNAAGIAAEQQYPTPAHRHEALADHPFRWRQYPVAQQWADEAFSLPLYPELTDEQQERVIEVALEGTRPLETA